MQFLPSHVFTPAALLVDEQMGPFVATGELRDRCVACEMPAAEHVDEAVLASYAPAVQTGDPVSAILACGHPGPRLSRTDQVWAWPQRGLWCATCSGTRALAEYAAPVA